MDSQHVVHRQSGTVHLAGVEEDRSVLRTNCGRVLDDMWYPIRREDVTCLTCAKVQESSVLQAVTA